VHPLDGARRTPPLGTGDATSLDAYSDATRPRRRIPASLGGRFALADLVTLDGAAHHVHTVDRAAFSAVVLPFLS
jgi:hypothetical protein